MGTDPASETQRVKFRVIKFVSACKHAHNLTTGLYDFGRHEVFKGTALQFKATSHRSDAKRYPGLWYGI